MANNKKKDKTIKCFSVISIILCLLTATWGFVVSYFDMDFKTEKSNDIYVSSTEDISSLGESVYNNKIYLQQDITITDPSFKIGNDEFPFEGVFDGQGHTVYFNYQSASAETSLFDYLAPGSVIKNVNFVFDKIELTGTSFGGVAKINDGTIENCKVVFSEITISGEGMFSPLVTINRGTISNVVVRGSIIGNNVADHEREVFYGNACVYNAGVLRGAIVTAEYSGFACTDELNILKGLAKNIGISSVRYADIDEGQTELAVSCLKDAQFTSDKTSVVNFVKPESLYNAEKIFDELDFNNKHWKIDGLDLKLIIGEKQ